MDLHANSKLYRRIIALERAVDELRATLNQPGEVVTTLNPAQETGEVVRWAAALHPATEQPRTYCPHCAGDNPPDEPRCRWCGGQLWASALLVAEETVPMPGSVSGTDFEAEAEIVEKYWDAGVREPRGFRLPSFQLDVMRSAEFWLNKVGIVLFLFGVAFLFKYAVDKAWLDEQARLGAGLMLGTALLGFGLHLRREHRHLSQVLMGGSIATYYITGYAGYVLFRDLQIPYTQALVYMLAVTMLSFALAVRQHEAALSVVGVLGGLLTPFVLGFDAYQVPGVIIYTCLVLAGTSASYLARGWRSLLWTSAAGAWAIMGTALDLTSNKWDFKWHGTTAVTVTDRLYLQGGALAVLLAFAVVPVAQEVLLRRWPERWLRPTFAWVKDPLLSRLLSLHTFFFAAVIPPACLAYSWAVWSSRAWSSAPALVSWHTWGVVSLAGAGVGLLVFLGIRSAAPRLAYVHALLSVGLLTLGLVQLLEGNVLLLALALEAAALHAIARRWPDRGMAVCGNWIFAGVGVWLVFRLLPSYTPVPALYNVHVLSDLAPVFTDLAVLGLAFGVSLLMRARGEATAFRSIVHLALLALIWREVHGFPNGDGYVMLAWATYGSLLHLTAGRLRNKLDATATAVAAHVAFEAAMSVLAWRLATGFSGEQPLLNQKAIVDLLFIGLALASSFLVKHPQVRAVYRIAVHTAVLAWLSREATPADIANGYVMVRWAAYLLTAAFISHRVRDRATLVFINAPYPLIAAFFAARIAAGHAGELALLNARTLLDLVVVGCTMALSLLIRPRQVAILYRLAGHAGVMALLWRELHTLHNGADLVLFSWAAYAAVLYLAAKWRRDKHVSLEGHAVFALAGGILLEKIAWGLWFTNETQTPVLNLKGLADLGVIVLGAAVWLTLRDRRLKTAYALGLHVCFLGWMWQEIGLAKAGNGYVSIAWGVYGLALIGIGARGRQHALMLAGIATFFAVAAKLFLVDPLYLETIWRILLFLGFGAFFLLTSYGFQKYVLNRTPPDESEMAREV